MRGFLRPGEPKNGGIAKPWPDADDLLPQLRAARREKVNEGELPTALARDRYTCRQSGQPLRVTGGCSQRQNAFAAPDAQLLHERSA